MSCLNETVECFVLDDNGFVTISEDKNNVGKFLGDVDGSIMDSLVHNQVFKKIKIVDYQGVCMEAIHEDNNIKGGSKKTKPKSCDKEISLYKLMEESLSKPLQGTLRDCNARDCERLVVQLLSIL